MRKSDLNRRSSGKPSAAFPALQKDARGIYLTADDCDPILTANQFFGERKFVPHGNAPSSWEGVRRGGKYICLTHSFIKQLRVKVRCIADAPVIDAELGNSANWKIETVIQWKHVVDIYCKMQGIDRDAILAGESLVESMDEAAVVDEKKKK